LPVPHATDLDLTARDVSELASPDAVTAFLASGPRSGERKRHFWRFIDAKTHEIEENRYEMARLIFCLPDEPRYLATRTC
jgi:hypothetical protein